MSRSWKRSFATGQRAHDAVPPVISTGLAGVGSAIPAEQASTRHHCGSGRTHALDKPVDQRGISGGRTTAFPQAGSRAICNLWKATDNSWTTAPILTRGNGGLSTIHRTYYPYYRFNQKKLVLTTTPWSEPRPIDHVEKNREYQR